MEHAKGTDPAGPGMGFSLEIGGASTSAASLEWNGVGCLQEAVVGSGRRLSGARLSIEVDGDPHPAEFPCPPTEPGVAVALDLSAFRLPVAILREATERRPVEIRASLRDAEGLALAVATHRLEALPATHWCGLARAGESLASFVTPNAPELASLARDAAARLASETGRGALDGYQSGSAERVQRLAAALFEALGSRGIAYVPGMPSFETEGQKVRTAAETLGTRLGNCLDLSVTLAALLELAGVHATLLVGDGHATVGFATVEEHFSDPVHRGPSRVRNRHDLGQLRVIEATAACAGGGFAAALEAGSRWIASASEEIAVIDLPAARRAGFHPLPERQAALAVDAAALTTRPETAPVWKVVQPVGLPKAAAPDRSPRERRLEGWKRKLLDLTLRNRLLNDRGTAGVPLAIEGDEGLATLEDVLWEERPLRLIPALERGSIDAAGLRAEIASRLLRSSLPDAELFARATRVDRDGRLSLEEHGARSLFLAIGFLEFRPPQRPEPVRAPIVLVPVRLRRISRQEGFEVVAVNEDTVANLALHEHFRQSEGKDLGIGGDLPTDDRGVDLAAVLATVRHAVRDLPGATVHATAKLGTYSFKKLPLFEAMRHEEARLLGHPIVATFLDRSAAREVREARLFAPEDLRGKPAFAESRLPLPADSSQVAAVRSATGGATFVLQGPPGTGKSQTITNLLAECLARGKRVLFVAEKSAALAVVSDRLEKVGLGAFALDLHSDRATKTSFVEQIKRAKEDTDARTPVERRGFAAALESLDATVARLERCGEALHEPRASEEGRLTAYEAIERSIGLAAGPDPGLPIALPREGRRDDLAARVAAARALGAAAQDLPAGAAGFLARFDPPEAIGVEAAEALARRAADAGAAAARLERNAARLAASLAVPVATTFVELRGQAEFARKSARLDPRLVPIVSAALGTAGDRVAGEVAAAVAAIEAARAARAELAGRWTESLFTAETRSALGTLAGDLRAARARFVLFRWSAARRARTALARHARAALPKGFTATLAEVERLEAALATVAGEAAARETLRRILEADLHAGSGEDLAFLSAAAEAAELAREHRGRFEPRGAWREGLRRPDLAETLAAIKPDFALAWEAARELDTALAPREPLAAPQATLAALRLAAEGIVRDAATIAPASAFAAARQAATRLGLAPVAAALAEGRVAPSAAAAVAERALLAGWIRDRLANSPALADATRERAESLRGELATGLAEWRAGVPVAIVRAARERIRAGLARLETDDPASLRTLLGLLAVSTIRRPIRRVMAEGAAAIATLKPIVLASPLSAATHLPPEFPDFDLVVFDEASQVPTHDAACALGRARAAVIVGDSRQLPPTTFFDRSGDASDAPARDDDLESLESVLDEAIAAGIPERSLLWHYRSRDERLIDFSNRRSYGGRLQTFPAPFRAHPNLGVEFRLVAGTYDRGGTATNRAEAEAVVAEVIRRLKEPDPTPANRSIGAVTFSQAQQTLVQDLLDAAGDADPLVRERLAEAAKLGEAVFVKNLENVQGDERATMLFSICYGRDAEGRLAHSFGPLNLAGGERRLNVAVTRAREKVVVFSSIRASDLDPAKCVSRGAQDLRSYLAYAELGTVPPTAGGPRHAREPEAGVAEEFLAARLRERGLTVELLVGRSSDFRVSLAVGRPSQPDRWLLGIDLDGQFHRSAPTVLDREATRTGVLVDGLKWTLLRVSIVDLFRDPAGTVERIAAAT
jgi:hypothetical protein